VPASQLAGSCCPNAISKMEIASSMGSQSVRHYKMGLASECSIAASMASGKESYMPYLKLTGY
jgi:hypothetical protein